MSNNRRKFIQQLATTTSALAVGLPSFARITKDEADTIQNTFVSGKTQDFNMCGYAAPKIDTVRVGIIGLGNRGSGAVDRLSYIDGLEIVALCDKYPDRVAKQQLVLQNAGRPKAKEFSGETGWKSLCEMEDLDLVYTPTPWELHSPIALYAMNHGKHVATEVNAALTIDDCWKLVETSEKTRKHCMMLENCCYDFFELLTLNMARNGLFGELLHAEGAYIHNLSREYLFNKEAYADMWRLKQNIGHNGNLYPTHGLGPIAQCLNINRGDKFEYLTSTSTFDFTLKALAKEKAETVPFFKVTDFP